MKRLEWLSVEDYGTTPKEVIIVSAMKGKRQIFLRIS